MIKILQSNLERSQAAHDLAHKRTLEDKIDLLIGSEPNKRITESDIEVSNLKNRNGFVWIQLRDISFFNAYFSPNIRLQKFNEGLDLFFETVRDAGGRRVVVGDLNAKALAWGSRFTDARGCLLCECIATQNMVVMNDGTVPTCVIHSGESVIDITMAFNDVSTRIKRWEILQEETLSAHTYICYEIVGNADAKRAPRAEKLKENLNMARCETLLENGLS